MMNLVCSQKVEDDEDVGDVDEPEGLVESKAGEHVSMGIVAECSVAKACAHQVEYCRG